MSVFRRSWGRKLAGTAVAVVASGLAIWPLNSSISHARDTPVIFAAASLARALNDILADHMRDTGQRVAASYASSGTLARQIENGAQATLFISANDEWTAHLAKAGLLSKAIRERTLTSNSLVLIAPKAQTYPAKTDPLGRDALAEWLTTERLAMANPDHAPVGRYGRQALQALGVWDVVAPRLAIAQHASAAVTMVVRGEAALGLVYKSDVHGLNTVTVLAEVPRSTHDPIHYTLAAVAGQDLKPVVKALMDRLTGDKARAVLESYGFQAVEDR